MEQVKQNVGQGAPASEQDLARTNGQLDHFPTHLDFFGMGVILSKGKSCTLAESATSPFLVTFTVSGEESGLCVVAFEKVPATSPEGLSMAHELANILASKFITRLADTTLSDIRISPPAQLETGSQTQRYVAATLTNSTLGCSRKYDYAGKGLDQARVAMRLSWLPSLRGGHT